MRNAVVVAADRNIFPAAMFLCDRLRRLGPPPDTDIILASDSIADIEIARAAAGAPALLAIGAEIVDRQFPLNRHFTKAAYYNMFMPEILADKYGRVLLLDVDVYAHNRKIFDLFDVDMGQYAVGAVRETFVAHARDLEIAKELKQTLVGGIAGKYLNSGVLLVDVPKFHKQRLEERFLAVVGSHPTLAYLDQSALNIALKGDWLELSPSFNLQGSAWNSFIREICEPVIVHFVGETKPWHGPRFVEDHPFRLELERYIANSLWKGFLARFWTFQDAWRARSEPAPTRRRFTNNPVEIGRIVNYLHETEFADVKQGLTTLNFDEPRRAQPPR